MSQSQSPSLEPRTASSNCSRLLRSWRADSSCFLRLVQIIQKKAVRQPRNEIRSRTKQGDGPEVAPARLVEPVLEQAALGLEQLAKDRAGLVGRVPANLGGHLDPGLARARNARLVSITARRDANLACAAVASRSIRSSWAGLRPSEGGATPAWRRTG